MGSSISNPTNGASPGAPSPFRGRARAATLALLVATSLAGCQRALFPADAPRTQFELQDRMRGRYVPLEEPDVFGKPQPALRRVLSGVS